MNILAKYQYARNYSLAKTSVMSNISRTFIIKSGLASLLTVFVFLYDGSLTSAKMTPQLKGGDHSPANTAIPILCYHQIRDWKSTDTKNDRVYILPINAFREQIRSIRSNGYHAISPDQLIDHMQNGTPLPEKPILLTFDDGTESQYLNALPELNAAGFKAVFFIMTAVLDHHPFMSKSEVAALSRQGHVIGCHTWDHHSVTGYKESDWKKQIEKSRNDLEKIAGKSVKYFAYPYGAWNTAALPMVERYGFTAAFQLWGKNDELKTVYTIKRLLVSGYWNSSELLNAIHKIEKQQ